MKIWIPMLLLLLSVVSLCVWDGIHTNKSFSHMEKESNEIYIALQTTSITDENLQEKIISLNAFWTEKMDMLSISISRKDLQPVSDYLQYLYASILNESQEDAITYSRLLHYNVQGLQEANGINALNLL